MFTAEAVTVFFSPFEYRFSQLNIWARHFPSMSVPIHYSFSSCGRVTLYCVVGPPDNDERGTLVG